MTKKPKTVWAIDDNNILYVKIKYCGISTLFILTDGLTITTWKGDKYPYIKAEDALNWFKNESKAMLKRGPTNKDKEEYKNYIKFIQIYEEKIKDHNKEVVRRYP